MKFLNKVLLFLLISFLFSVEVQSQAPQGRTISTIVTDALAQLPASTQEGYNQLMTDLVSTGDQGLLELIGRMNPPGNKSNEAVELALSGWSNFAAKDGDKRRLTANVFSKALVQPLDKETKAFLIRQLERVGSNENVSSLSAFLQDPSLSAPAAQALVSIGGRDAGHALETALASAGDEVCQVNLVNAIGQTGSPSAEAALLPLFSLSSSPKLRNALFNTLGKTGTLKALPLLKEAAQNIDFAYRADNSATASYLSLLKRLRESDGKVVEREAKSLLGYADKHNNDALKIAASEILLSLPKANKRDILKKALKDNSHRFLHSVLNSYPFEKDRKSLSMILESLSSQTSPEKQASILYWMGDKKIANLSKLLAPFALSNNKVIQKAAISSLTKYGGDDVLPILAGLLISNDQSTVQLGQEALSSYHGDIAYTLASVFNKSSDIGKKAILQLIANRKMEDQYALVYNQMFADNTKEVKSEAANTLQYVVTDKNLPDLFTLLEQSDRDYIPALQGAINASLSSLPAKEQMGIITARMEKSTKKQLYYPALANTGLQEAVDVITNAYDTESGAVKEAAFSALANRKSFDAIYTMLHIGRNSQNSEERSKVTDALVDVIGKSDKTGAVKYLYLREAMQFAQNNQQRNSILQMLSHTGHYQAMLYAASFMDHRELSESAALAVMNIALSNIEFAGAETVKLLNKAANTLRNSDADYQRQSINKYLDETPQENGFVSIFNGKNLEGWKGLVENPIKRAQMSKKDLNSAQAKADAKVKVSWIVENGELLFTGEGDNLCTVKEYGDFEMLVDWKLYEGPEPDAGIYLRGTPQVQIWDTARVNVGAQVGSGGLYNNQKNESKPSTVADQKVGEWNTFRIRMVGERVSVWLNGELVTDNVILENYWDRSQSIFPTEQIELQAHGSKVAYRDIYIKELERPEPFKLSAEEEKEGFELLFDGTHLDMWTGNKTDYVVESGDIVLYPSQSFGGNLYTKEQYDNFVFRFEFMLTPGANNGLGIRTPMEGDAAYVGMELQILDNEAPVYKDLQIYQYHGSVYGVIPAKRGYLKPTGEWNYQEVIADGDHIKVILNGTTILDGNIREASKNGTIDKQQHPGLLNKIGHIGFLGHGSMVKFRNIRIKELR